MIIELLHGLTKFRNILINPYFINNTSININHSPILNSSIAIPIP